MKIILFFISIGIINAGTVTLFHSCSYNSGQINFTLSNQGNDSASNLIIIPKLLRLSTNSSFGAVSILGPNKNTSFSVKVNNIIMNGSYGVYFILTYLQGSSPYTVIAPCIVQVGKTLQSQLLLLSNVTSSTDITANIMVYNAGIDNVTANLTLIMPPGFNVTSNKTIVADIPPYKTNRYTYKMKYSAPNLVPFGAVFGSYIRSNVIYTAMLPINVPPKPLSNSLQLYLFGGVAVLIVLIILLILRAYMLKRRKEQNKAQPPLV